MWAKTLLPAYAGTPAIPSITGTTSQADGLFPQLLARGWSGWGVEGPNDAPTSLVLITHESMQLTVEDQIVLDDRDARSPDGWWKAVDVWDQRVVVSILRSELFDMADPMFSQHAQDIFGTQGAGVWALVPLVHPARPL